MDFCYYERVWRLCYSISKLEYFLKSSILKSVGKCSLFYSLYDAKLDLPMIPKLRLGVCIYWEFRKYKKLTVLHSHKKNRSSLLHGTSHSLKGIVFFFIFAASVTVQRSIYTEITPCQS